MVAYDPGLDPGRRKAGAAGVSMACGMNPEKMTAAQRVACACKGVTELTSIQQLTRIAATKRDACSGIAADRLAQLLPPPIVVASASGGGQQ